MVKIRLEKDGDAVWFGIDNSDWEISREAFSQLCIGMERFDAGADTVKEIRLDVADDDFEDFAEEESPDHSFTGEAIAKRLRGK